jgi:iron complex transport system ATP-binding protein
MTRPVTPPHSAVAVLEADGLTVRYGKQTAVDAVNLHIERGSLTAIIGPNGCGKSTLLRALGRLLAPDEGVVRLLGEPISTLATREVARVVGILPQSPQAPDGLTVADLVARGRDPHRRWYDQWSHADELVVAESLRRTGLTELADRPLESLSGGQRQRAWIAMALAQGTEILLLDEPTTFLDVVHQLDVLELVRELHGEGITVVMVLHDLSMAARYADRLVAMLDGSVVADGTPIEVLTTSTLERVFELHCEIVVDSRTGRPIVVPIARATTTTEAN